MCPEDDGSVSLELERFAEMYDGPLDYFLPDRSPGPVDLVDTGSRGITRSELLSRAAPGPPGSRPGGEGEARVWPGVGPFPAFGVSSVLPKWAPSIPWGGGAKRRRARGESDEPPHSDCRPGTMRRGFRPPKPQNRGSPPNISPITYPASRVVTGSAPRGECGVPQVDSSTLAVVGYAVKSGHLAVSTRTADPRRPKQLYYPVASRIPPNSRCYRPRSTSP